MPFDVWHSLKSVLGDVSALPNFFSHFCDVCWLKTLRSQGSDHRDLLLERCEELLSVSRDIGELFVLLFLEGYFHTTHSSHQLLKSSLNLVSIELADRSFHPLTLALRHFRICFPEVIVRLDIDVALLEHLELLDVKLKVLLLLVDDLLFFFHVLEFVFQLVEILVHLSVIFRAEPVPIAVNGRLEIVKLSREAFDFLVELLLNVAPQLHKLMVTVLNSLTDFLDI